VDYLHTEPLSKLVILPMDGSPPIICLKCGSYIVWSTQPHLVYRTPTRVCHTEEQCVCHTEEQCVCHTEEQLVSPVTRPLLGKRCWPAWPHYTLPHPNGKRRSQGESSDGGGNASFHDLRCSRHPAHRAPGSPQTPAQAPRAPEDQGHSPERPRTGANDTRC
jgi:hypothetical protein